MGHWKRQTLIVLSLLLGLFSTQATGADCWDILVVKSSTIVRIEGINYSNCYLETRLDSDFVWLRNVVFDKNFSDYKKALARDYPDISQTPFCQNLINQGASHIKAMAETNKAQTEVSKRAFDCFKGVKTNQAFEAALKYFQTVPFSKDLGIDIVWKEELGQPFISTAPSTNWTSIWPEFPILRKASLGAENPKELCNAWEEIKVFLNTGDEFKHRAVVFSEGTVEYLEMSSRPKLVEALSSY